MQTVKRDYLEILIFINFPFGIVSMIASYAAYEGGSLYILLSYFFLAYGLIFCVLIFKLLQKTKEYLHVSNVVFTEQGILLGKDFIKYTETKKRNKLLEKYEDIFDEYLTHSSQLSKIIKAKQDELKNKVEKLFTSAIESADKIDRNVKIFITMSISLYTVFLVVFYFLGIGVGFLFFGIFAGILKIFLFFSRKTELQIKYSVEKLEKNIENIQRIESVLEKKLSQFSGGEISDISGFVGEKFEYFYSGIGEILEEKNNLKKIILHSQYQKFIDFEKFSGYIKKQYNKPVHHMIEMLEIYSQKISDQKILLQQEISGKIDTKKPENSAHLTKKILRFQQLEKDAQGNLEKMRLMRI